MRGITPQERLEKWNEAICAQKASGLTIKDWCEQNGISPNTYYYYLRRICDTMLESSGPRLVEMEFPAADLPAGKSAAQDGFLPWITITLRDCVITYLRTFLENGEVLLETMIPHMDDKNTDFLEELMP